MKPILLVPIAGKGQRFINDGYKLPKQLIQVGHKTMIEWSLSCIDYKKFETIFIVRRDQIIDFEIDKFIIEKFGSDVKLVISEEETDGTVSSCLLAKDHLLNSKPLVITTLDVYFEPHFTINESIFKYDGCIITFDSNNPSYSYSLIEDDFVIKTAEKEVISNDSSLGIYCFSKSSDFVKYAQYMIDNNIRTRNEFYICPLYNLLIKDGLKINTQKVKDVYNMGTPSELGEFLKIKHKINDY
jgi:hypothetical protein